MPPNTNLRYILFTDSSFANTKGHYPQACQLLFLTYDLDSTLDSLPLLLVFFNGSKSHRVAKSTHAAETLAAVKGVERASRYQEWWLEAHESVQHPRALMSVPSSYLIPVDLIVDCDDLYQNMIQPAVGSQQDAQMAVYVSALRHDIATGRIRGRFWVPTDDVLANAGTKIDPDGTAPLQGLPTVLSSGRYHISSWCHHDGHECRSMDQEVAHVNEESPREDGVVSLNTHPSAQNRWRRHEMMNRRRSTRTPPEVTKQSEYVDTA